MSRRRLAQVLAIGAGPANLSLAALAEPLEDISVTILEARDSVSWHPGLLWSNSRLQVDGIKDLVSLIDPRSEFSFMNFLHEEGRLYRHLIASKEYVSRAEFDQYFSWVAGRLDVHLGTTVKSIEHDGCCFLVETNSGTWEAETLVIGVGQAPFVPDCAQEALGPGTWHSVYHLKDGMPVGDKHVLLVGGGQSSGEVAHDLLSGRTGLPSKLTWATGRGGLTPLDDSPFSDEWFNPAFVDYFNSLGAAQRDASLVRQQAAYFGINRDLLALLYRRLYELDYLIPGTFTHEIMAGVRLSKIWNQPDGFGATLRDVTANSTKEIDCDLVIFGTGFKNEIPRFFEPIMDRIMARDGSYRVGDDYRIGWSGSEKGGIYVQNAALKTHGVADANISLAAWRSAKILNSILGTERYSIGGQDITHLLGQGFNVVN
ncbi:lysine N(6)-hydroxylase/L-ornithine N(5)-oxygenase family protein [Streptomyces mirabilis]|uniref:L-lysine N6-monooxygenase MbtG n=1 Tax=Streptomyces mirabilis TaxID=68239 RepID=A0ABU3V5Y0_9ACTN|nr:SidA/IucD/PvdA family monooxygenase [Streptomyces mirabilis]MCX5357040.1 SidA/IucD/PvdA family monooxygenase [Streptomyces mirabilis]MDU9001577.1 SidA/IucD/PvdA family monooxygenase [Streptomyces mirabilis]